MNGNSKPNLLHIEDNADIALIVSRVLSDLVDITLVTNLAAGISKTPLSHQEVQETAAAARDRFTALLDRLLVDLAG